MRLVIDMIEFCAREMPFWHPMSISGYHIREAGSTAAQELAFTLADGFAYVEAAVERGLFFFQAEDGIRDYKVTGVQTCALPIWRRAATCSVTWLIRACTSARGCATPVSTRARRRAA